jgi:TIR domain
MKVFLSYARTDRDIAREMVDRLHNSGHELWFDEFELTPGTAWGREIDKALRTSKAMIVLVSAASMNSKEVRREIDHALLSQNFAHRVLPVYLEPTDDVPWFLRTQKGIHVGENLSRAVRQVKSALDHFSEQLEVAVEGNA